MSLLQGEGRWFESIRPYQYFFKGGAYHGIGEAGAKKSKQKRRFHIIEHGTKYVIKRKFGLFWFYVRDGIKNGFRKRKFDFTDAVIFVNSRR